MIPGSAATLVLSPHVPALRVYVCMGPAPVRGHMTPGATGDGRRSPLVT